MLVQIVKEYRETARAPRVPNRCMISVCCSAGWKLSIPNDGPYHELKSNATFSHSSKIVQTFKHSAACVSKSTCIPQPTHRRISSEVSMSMSHSHTHTYKHTRSIYTSRTQTHTYSICTRTKKKYIQTNTKTIARKIFTSVHAFLLYACVSSQEIELAIVRVWWFCFHVHIIVCECKGKKMPC